MFSFLYMTLHGAFTWPYLVKVWLKGPVRGWYSSGST